MPNQVETLTDLRQKLSAAPSYPWQHLANWIEETEPFIVAHFGSYMDQFRRLTQKPPSLSYPMVFGKNTAENNEKVKRFSADRELSDKKNYGESKARLISFLDGVIRAEQHKQASTEESEMLDEAPMPTISQGPPIFISHASKDSKLVNAFADLLQLTCDLPQKDVFCTSVDGMSIPNGLNFVDVIRERLVGSKLVVFVLSQAYFDSEFCLTELGAAWAMATRPLFLIVPPIDYSDLKGVLQNLQAGKINEPAHLTNFREELEKALGLPKTSGSRWEAKRQEFLATANDFIPNQPAPTHITTEAHRALEAKHAEAMSELQKVFAVNKALTEKYAVLETKKDKEEVKAVAQQFSPKPTENDKYKLLFDSAQGAVLQLPTVVQEILFRHFKNEETYSNDYNRTQLTKAADEKFLTVNQFTSAVKLNEPDLKVSEAIGGLNGLNHFLLAKASKEWKEKKTKELGFAPELDNKRYWDILVSG